ncbi:GNAT family N-acetyltransferase [Nonomuraea sp. C10]|uniref:GNAT family N-acetyltransferase n=1 Tax=Nonomuraea sp. C10 TaxID=2600577 RepID=UPI0011CECA94|nr:GNAT family N-acetyltransferase [Nonomuraea sp. C10]TXK41209.1 GNAT family N-acetyltransferase [Nonomuraea sp. C10]
MHHFSRPGAGDAPAIHELSAACDTEVLGRPDLTLDDIAGELAEPGFDLDSDAWLAHGPDGRLDGWAWARRQGASEIVDADVIVRPGVAGLAERLWPLVLERAGALAREAGHPAAVTDVGVYRADRAKQALVTGYGFAAATSFHRMRVDFDGPVEAPEPPPGVTLHGGQNEQVRREAHEVYQEGFADHFGHAYVDYDRWYARRQAIPTTDWSQLTLARVDGRAAAMVLGNNQFAADEGCGYVDTLAVRPEFRGRGLGRLLLRTAIAADAARGREGTILHVDTNNTTPALGLYESEGMRPVLVIDIWRRTVEPGTVEAG